MLTIHQRPFPPEDRSEAGHWEGDLIVGKDQALGDRHARRTADPDGPAAAPSAAATATPCTTR